MVRKKSESEKNKRPSNLIPPDWKDHFAKAFITLALGGLGTLMLVSGRFLINAIPTLEKRASELTIFAHEEQSKFNRAHELCVAVQETVPRTEKRITGIAEYLNSHKSHVDTEKFTALVNVNAAEAARDSGRLSGYTPETTGLSIGFHESLRGFLKTELDFWHTLEESTSAIRTNPKTRPEKIQEIHYRLQNMVYAMSLFESSMRDATETIQSRIQKDKEIAQSAKEELQFDAALLETAWWEFILTALFFLALACLIVVDRLRSKMAKSMTK